MTSDDGTYNDQAALIDLGLTRDEANRLLAPDVDIIAVHGLYEDALRTWTRESVLWLRDIFPHRSYKARVLAYRYDASNLLQPGRSDATSISNEAQRLVTEVCADRQINKCFNRPIVFVCHGFGGLLVKRALSYATSRIARSLEHQQLFAICTTSIIFFATPHHGVTKESVMGARLDPSNLHLSLLEGSAILQEISDQFAPLVKNYQISTYWECMPTSFENREYLFVRKDSAAPFEWDEADKAGIMADHSGIAKFISSNSSGYAIVAAALDRYLESASATVARRLEEREGYKTQEMSMEMDYLQKQIAKIDPASPQLDANIGTVTSLFGSPAVLRSASAGEPLATGNVHYLVDRGSDIFVGRQSQAEEVRVLLGKRSGKKPKVFIIYGLPGSGKSQFCLKYLEDSRDSYWGCFWIDCSTKDSIENSYARLSRKACRGDDASGGRQWLCETTEPWLLVLDNANDPDLDLSTVLPASGNGHILITTRNPHAQINNMVGRFQFTGMDPEEAISMLLKLAYPQKNMANPTDAYRVPAERIALELGYLALALKQAAYTIRRDLLTLQAYLKALLGWRKDLLSSPSISSAPEANIIATWEIPFSDIIRGSTPRYKDAVHLLHLLAFMHHATIPHTIFSRACASLRRRKPLEMHINFLLDPDTAKEVEDRVRKAAALLYEHSIISVSDPNVGLASGRLLSQPTLHLSLHPAIHQWARVRLSTAQQRQWLKCTSSTLASAFSSNMEASAALFRRSLLPHIDSCVSFLLSSQLKSSAGVEQIGNLEKFALVYAESGLWRRARPLQQKVVTAWVQLLGPRSSLTIQARRRLAITHWNLFEIRECIEQQQAILRSLLWLSLGVQRRLNWPSWQPNYRAILLSLSEISASLWLAGERERSEKAAEVAVDGLSRLYGKDDPVTLNAMFNLARTCLHIGKHDKSEHLLSHVHARRLRYFGPHHPDTLMARHELGMAQFVQGKTHQALKVVLEVLEARSIVLGKEHAYTLWSVNDLAKLYCELGDPDEAIRILLDIIPIVSRTLGDTHVGMIMTKANLVKAWGLKQTWSEAYKYVIDLRDLVGSEHPDWVHIEYGYACCMAAMGETGEAEMVCLKLLDHIKKTLVISWNNPRIQSIVELLESIYMRGSAKGKQLAALHERFPDMLTLERLSSIDHMPHQDIITGKGKGKR